MQPVVTEVCATSMHIISIDMLCIEQKWNKMHKMLVSQIFHSNKNTSKSFTLSADGVLQMHQYVHGL